MRRDWGGEVRFIEVRTDNPGGVRVKTKPQSPSLLKLDFDHLRPFVSLFRVRSFRVGVLSPTSVSTVWGRQMGPSGVRPESSTSR